MIPASRGFCITLRKTLATFKEVLIKEGIIERNNDAHAWENSKEQTKSEAHEISKIADSDAMEYNSKKKNSEGSCKLTPKNSLSKDRVSSSSSISSASLSEMKKTALDHTIS